MNDAKIYIYKRQLVPVRAVLKNNLVSYRRENGVKYLGESSWMHVNVTVIF